MTQNVSRCSIFGVTLKRGFAIAVDRCLRAVANLDGEVRRAKGYNGQKPVAWLPDDPSFGEKLSGRSG